MTEQETQQLECIIARMSDAEKRALRDRLERSLTADGGEGPSDEVAPSPREPLDVFFRRIAAMPMDNLADFIDELDRMPGENPDDRYSGRDHDEVLYGWDKK